VVIIVLSILSGLTGVSLVIQRQVKAVHQLGSSGPSDFYGTQHFIALLFIVGWISFFTISPFIFQAIADPRKEVDPKAMVISIQMLFIGVPIAFLGAMGFLTLRYLSRIIYGLLTNLMPSDSAVLTELKQIVYCCFFDQTVDRD
jgi:hypothetical protein